MLKWVRKETPKLSIRKGSTLTAEQVQTLLTEPYEFPKEVGGARKTKRMVKVMLFVTRSNNGMEQLDMIVASSFQPNGISLEDLKNLQQKDEYCEEIRLAMKHEGRKYIYGYQDGLLE